MRNLESAKDDIWAIGLSIKNICTKSQKILFIRKVSKLAQTRMDSP